MTPLEEACLTAENLGHLHSWFNRPQCEQALRFRGDAVATYSELKRKLRVDLRDVRALRPADFDAVADHLIDQWRDTPRGELMRELDQLGTSARPSPAEDALRSIEDRALASSRPMEPTLIAEEYGKPRYTGTRKGRVVFDDPVIQQLPKEQPMTTIKIETKHFVNGHDVTRLTDDELLSLIAQAEAEIAKYEAVKTPPARITKLVTEKKAKLAELVAFLDKLDAEKAQ